MNIYDIIPHAHSVGINYCYLCEHYDTCEYMMTNACFRFRDYDLNYDKDQLHNVNLDSWLDIIQGKVI